MCAPALLRARGELGIFHLLPALEGEGAEERGEGRLELSPCAHLPEQDSGGPAPHPALHGLMPPAGDWAPQEHPQFRSASFWRLALAAGVTWGCINPPEVFVTAQVSEGHSKDWADAPAGHGHCCPPALPPKGLTATRGSPGRPRTWFVFPHL